MFFPNSKKLQNILHSQLPITRNPLPRVMSKEDASSQRPVILFKINKLQLSSLRAFMKLICDREIDTVTIAMDLFPCLFLLLHGRPSAPSLFLLLLSSSSYF
jgi:hypothetical protein